MKRALVVFGVMLAVASARAADAVPGTIFVQTARVGTTLATGKDAKPEPLVPEKTFSANGQVLDVPANLTATFILSNGDALHLPVGGRLTFEEFTQGPVADTNRDRDYEPSSSTLRLNLAQGTLVVSGRKPVPTSKLIITTPLANFTCQSPSFVIRVEGESVTLTLFDGTAEVNVPETGFHETLQAGQTATLTKQNLHANYPLKLSGISTADNTQFSAWLATARATERRLIFTGTPGKLTPRQQIPMEFTQQGSVDDPRLR